MNIVFFGSSCFAVPTLKALVSGRHNIQCVVTQPDRKRGRHLYLAPTPAKEAALEYGIEIYQPSSVNSQESVEFLVRFKADIFIVMSYGQILSKDILALPKNLPINAHASILPEYRGAAPINWALINGEEETGVTIIKMTSKMDAGPIIIQRSLKISDTDTEITLEDKLSKLAAQMVLVSLASIQANKYTLQPQDEKQVSFAPKLRKEDGRINWNRQAQQIMNQVRGCLFWPGAFSCYKNRILKVHRASVTSLTSASEYKPGQIIDISKKCIWVMTGKDALCLEEIQIEGKRKMTIEEFICGHKVSIGDTFI